MKPRETPPTESVVRVALARLVLLLHLLAFGEALDNLLS